MTDRHKHSVMALTREVYMGAKGSGDPVPTHMVLWLRVHITDGWEEPTGVFDGLVRAAAYVALMAWDASQVGTDE